MSPLWIALIALATTPTGGDTSPVTASASHVGSASAGSEASDAAKQDRLVPFRTGLALRDATRKALARWVHPEDQDAAVAAKDFLVLYRELQVDRDMVAAQRDLLRSKVRGRLLELAGQIEKVAAVQRRLARENAKKEAKNGELPKSVEAAPGEGVLGQFGVPGGFGGGIGNGGAFGGAQGTDDYGEDLVELIQQTIVPSSWDVNGGPGSIYYWRPGRALVISASGEVHDQIADVLGQLEKAGR